MSPRVAQAVGRTFAALRFRNYRLYFVSQIVSFSGTWMQMIAQSWLVLQLTGSGTALGATFETSQPGSATDRAPLSAATRPARRTRSRAPRPRAGT